MKDPDDSPADGDALSVDSDLRRLFRAPPVEPEALLRRVAATRLEPGTVIDEAFVVCEEIGQGGMGVVYRARHDALDRDVAIKLCRRQATHRETARLRREAAATAALAHPNIVVVHDVGTVEGQVYVVMEHVSGGTLRQWLLAQTRSWKQIVTKVAEAAEGLAAAHAKGFVHRDFKPDNVLIGIDGRARVSDFGLAIAIDEPSSEPTARPDASAAAPRPHALAPASSMYRGGTPRYMAPEQHVGGPITAATDQFALCVALYEALSGEHPFVGKLGSPGATRRPSRLSRRIPRRVRNAIDRGLALDPARRHPSIRALIKHLTTEVRWRSAAALLMLGALGTTGMVLTATPASSSRCDAPLQSAPSWPEADRQRIRARFSDSTLRGGAVLGERVEAQLDDYLQQWQQADTRICRSTTDDPNGRAARNACMRARAAEFESLSGLLLEGDAEVLARSLGAAAQLSPPANCAQDELHLLTRDMGSNPNVTAARDVLNEHLAGASTALSAVELDRAMTHADAALAAALDDRGRARARLMRFRVLDQRKHHQDAAHEGELALQSAIQAGADDVAADVATLLVYTVGIGMGSPEAASKWVGIAKAWLVRLGEPAERRVTLDTYRGLLLRDSRRFDEAEALLRKTLEAARELEPARPHKVVAIRVNLASTLHRIDKQDEALAVLHQALKESERELGIDHPMRLTVLNMLSASLMRARRFEEGFERAHEALDGSVAVYGSKSPQVADAHVNIGTNLAKQQRHEESEQHYRIALPIYEREHDINSQKVVVRNLSQSAIATQRLDDALVLAQRDVELSDRLGRKPNLAMALSSLGRIQVMRREHEDAYATAQRLADFARDVYAPNDPQRVYAWTLLGNTAREVGELKISRDAFERARTLVAANSGPNDPMQSYLDIGLAFTHSLAGRHEDAVALLSGVDLERIELVSDRYAVLHVLATSRSALGDRVTARDDAERALTVAKLSGHAELITEATALHRQLRGAAHAR